MARGQSGRDRAGLDALQAGAGLARPNGAGRRSCSERARWSTSGLRRRGRAVQDLYPAEEWRRKTVTGRARQAVRGISEKQRGAMSMAGDGTPRMPPSRPWPDDPARWEDDFDVPTWISAPRQDLSDLKEESARNDRQIWFFSIAGLAVAAVAVVLV